MKKHKIIHQIIIIFACLFIAGCVSSKYSPPILSQELEYTSEIAEKYNVDEDWWKQYNCQELDRLLAMALANNPDYLKAALNIEKELASLNIANADLIPTFYANLAASTQKELKRGHASSQNYSGSLGLNYELDLYGKIRDASSTQEFEYKATMMDQAAARLSLINSVVDLYFNLEYLSNFITLTEQNIKIYQDLMAITTEKHKHGKVDNLTLTQARQSLIAEESQLLELKTQFQELEQSLRNILRLKPSENLDLQYSDILSRAFLPVDINVPLAVLANRPDILASQYRLEKAFKSLQAEEKSWYPSISLQGAISSSSDNVRSTFDFPYALGSISIDLPFLDWQRVKNEIKLSEADYKIYLLDFEDVINQALNEAAYYYFAYSQANALYTNIQETYQNTVQIATYHKLRYKAGKIELKDYLEALNSKNSAQKDLVQQKYQVIRCENYIYKAMGGKYQAQE